MLGDKLNSDASLLQRQVAFDHNMWKSVNLKMFALSNKRQDVDTDALREHLEIVEEKI